MGLREKVTIALVIIALTQIACRHCMPRSPSTASLKRYLNDLKPVKNNPISTTYSPSRVNKTPKPTIGKTVQNARTNQKLLQNKSLYKTYNFPETEYPLDKFPGDGFRNGMNFNDNYQVNNVQKGACNLRSSAINDWKKEMKMKRKLLRNTHINNENSHLQKEISTKFKTSPDFIHLFNSETFPEVQYPLNTMETWGPNYWNYLPFTEEKQFNGFEQQIFNPKAKEDIIKPFRKLTKATASKFLQSYDKLKEGQRHTSTENSKRSSVGQKGLNFTKTATSERVSDDFITASLVSNIPSHSTEIKNTLESTSKILSSSENTCPVTKYSYHLMPIPYKVIEENTENLPEFELKSNTEELQDVNSSIIAQTLQFIEEILLSDDTASPVSPGNFIAEVQKNMNTSDKTDVPEKKNIPITLVNSTESCTITPTEELLVKVSDNTLSGTFQNHLPSHPAKTSVENATTVASPFSVRMPLPFTETLSYEPLTKAPNSGPIPLLNDNAVPGSKSIIIIPMNNNALDESQSHMIESTSDTPIILYIPATQSSSISSLTVPSIQYVSSSMEKLMPNNKLYNSFSNMAPLQNDNPSSNAIVSELLNSISDSGSSLPMYETLPTNSMCSNNENSSSSTREKSFSNNLKHKSLIDDVPFVISTCNENSLKNTSTESYIKTKTLPPTSNFEHPLFDFAGSHYASLGHGPYNNILNNELPIIAREINSNQQIANVSSKDLFIPTQNVTSEYSQKYISTGNILGDSLSVIPNEVPAMTLHKNSLPEPTTNNLGILETDTPLSNTLLTLQVPIDNSIYSPFPIFKNPIEIPPQPINKILPSTPLFEAPIAEKPLRTETSLTPTPLSDTVSAKLPVIMDVELPPTSVSEITANSAFQPIDNTPASPSILNSYPKTTDNMTLNTALLPELYQIRQLIDKMLSPETLIDSQPSIGTKLSPISDYNSPPLPMNLWLQPNKTFNNLPLPEIGKTLLPVPETDNSINNLRPHVYETLPPISVKEIPKDTLSLPVDKLLISNIPLQTDSIPLHIDETVLPTPVSETFTDNKPYLIDNLVTTLSGIVTSSPIDTSKNGSILITDDKPSKLGLLVPDIYQISGDDLPFPVNDLPIIVHQEHTTNAQSRVSMNDGPMQIVETLNLLSDPQNQTGQSSLSADELLNDSLLAMLKPNNLDKHNNELSSESTLSDKPRADDCSADFLTPINKTPSMSTLPITKALLENVLSDIAKGSLSSPAAKPLWVTPSSSLDKMLYYVDKKSPLSVTEDIPVLPVEKIYPNIEHTNNPIDNMSFSYETEDTSTTCLPTDLTLPMDEILKDKPDITPLDVGDIGEGVNIESLHFDITEDNLSLPEDKILPDTELSDVLTDNINLQFSDQSEHITPLEVNTSLPVISNLDIRQQNSNDDLTLPTTEMLSSSVDDSPSNEPQSGNKTPSSFKLLITKAILENVLSDINTKGLSLPKALPVESRSQLDKTFYFLESLLPDVLTKNVTDNLTLHKRTDVLPFNKINEDKSGILTEEVEGEDLTETLSSENQTNETEVLAQVEKQFLTNKPDDLRIPQSRTQLSSRIPMTKALLEKVLSDVTDGLAA